MPELRPFEPVRVSSEQRKPGLNGWIYFVQADHGGPVKIGFTTNLKRRLGALQLGCPYRLIVRRSFEAGQGVEWAIHKIFEEHWLHGEWFSPAPGVCALGDAIPDDPLPDIEVPKRATRGRRSMKTPRSEDYERYQRIVKAHRVERDRRESERLQKLGVANHDETAHR